MRLGSGGGVSEFTLNKAHSVAFKVANRRRREFDPAQKWKWWKNWRYLSLPEFVSRCWDLAVDWQASLPLAVIVLVKRRGDKKKTLLFDGRLWAVQAAATGKPAIICWLLEKESGKLKRQYNDVSQIPSVYFSLLRMGDRRKRQSLCELVGLPAGSFPDPQNLYDLRQHLTDFCSVGADGGVTVVTGEDRDVCFSSGRQFVVEAKMDSQCAIYYQEPFYRQVKSLQLPKTTDLNADDENDAETLEKRMGEMFQANRSSATSVKLSGLNLAFSLGVISRGELVELSERLGKTCAAVALHLDEKGHLRHIFYRDPSESFGQTVTCFEEESENPREDLCRDEAVRNMNDFWDKVWARRGDWGVPTRTLILQDVIARLEHLVVSSCSTLYNSCLRDLKKCVALQPVVFFSSKEDQIHSVKYFLAHYACKILKVRRGLQLKTSCNNDINALVVPNQISLFNLQTYVSAKEDAEFFGEKRWISPPEIFHRVRNLRHQQTRPTVYSRTVSRARVIVFANLEFWSKFGRESVFHFGIDVHGNGIAFRSASLLAFESVWNRFAQLGGPLIQGPEKIKPHYAKMLRSVSRGGFMFSAQTLVEGGASCNDGPQSVMEFDISSAYGFSASNALMPSGFCNGFLNLKGGVEGMEEETEGEEGEDEKEEDAALVLEKTDPVRRHKTFEFRAVYFTLRRLAMSRPDIRTVFSNFSPSGLFYLDKYPADLVVVFGNGQIQVYQFDGHFVHGCDLCPSVSMQGRRFANGQTHEEVRLKTKRRDLAFEEWASCLNAVAVDSSSSPPLPKVEYCVISDCHSVGYSSWGLDWAFETDPVLQQLVVSYETVCGENGFGQRKRRRGGGGGSQELTLQSWLDFMKREENNTSFTCIAWLRGWCLSSLFSSSLPVDNATGCLITYPLDSGCGGGGCSLSMSTGAVPVALIRDYYQYLTSNHAFVVTDLEAVLFFKAEPLFNQVFQELVERRLLSRDPNEKNWIKRLVNLSCGFFGLHRSDEKAALGRRQFSIRCSIPKNFGYNVSTHRIEFQDRMTYLDNTAYFIMSVSSFTNGRSGRLTVVPANNALALFFTVVEMGKLRLVQALQFISRHIPPQRWSLLYSNVDNLIITLNGADNLDEAVLMSTDSQGYLDYIVEKSQFVAGDNSQAVEPGYLKLEWLCKSASWKFITAGIQQYVLREEEEEGGGGGEGGATTGRQKTSGLANLTNEKAFELARSLLFGTAVTVCQDRRIHKIESTATRRETLILCPLRRRVRPHLDDDDAATIAVSASLNDHDF